MSEKELVNNILRGDKNLFKEIVYKFSDKVLNVCYSILKNKEDSEDVSQEIFIEVFRSLSKFNWQSSLSTWIIRIAITRSLNQLNKRKIKKWLGSIAEIFSVSDEHYVEKIGLRTHTPFDNINDKETRTALFAALNSLPEAQRIAYSLIKVDNLSNNEVCDIMNLSVPAVESLIFRAKKNLQKSLRDFYEKNYK